MPEAAFVEMFDSMGAEAYDQFNAHFQTTKDNLQFISKLILQDIPDDSKILCVGVGTGEDILTLAKTYPSWSFVGIDPSSVMLEGCRTKLNNAGISERVELFQGFLSDYKGNTKFNAVLCHFVMHFIKNFEERRQMYLDMNGMLVNDGHLLISELSCDLQSPLFDRQLGMWKALHAFAGASEEKLENLGHSFKEQLGIIAPMETEKLIESTGFLYPVQFMQSMFVRSWHSQKND
tara:strand:+ start:278 stop:979 length:702 start_codon:yes stop_codon:yes gene_type:complete